MKQYYIYKVICPISNTPIYVGMTSNFEKRKIAHRSYCANTKIPEMDNWKQILKAKDLRASVEIIEFAGPRQNAKTREIYWVAELRKQGFTLFNKSPGGDLISPTHYWNFTKGKSFEEIYGEKKAIDLKRKIGDANKGEKNSNFGGKTCTEQWRKNSSKSNSKTPIVVTDKEGKFIGEFINSKDCAKFLGIGHSLVRMAKSGNFLARHKYKIQDKVL